ncbi:MAG: FHA domain-containing protein [Anaerolineae bacterium]|nr:FHA domain-containing protein [Anaerolineae bacterium]
MNQDRISIVEPNGIQRVRPLTQQGLTIGRGTESDLVLAYPVVSRNHARITCQGQDYYVTDLGSANGTYLGDARLEPNVPTLWRWGHPLRIGDIAVNLIQVERQHTASSNTNVTFVGMLGQVPGSTAKKKSLQMLVLWIVLLAVFLIVAAVVLYLVFF